MATKLMDVDALTAAFAGRILRPDEDGYEQARAVWNGDVTTRPALIAGCTGAADVISAIRFAREHDIEVSVRGGGHSVAGQALCTDGLVIDLSPMTGCIVDPEARRAVVQGGALWSQVDREAQAFGLAVTGGIVSHTGVAGLTLGGGIGHLMRKFGLTVDSLRACDLVTAEGEFVRASADENPDLFWGLRGGGGNFGIVTSFTFDLHEVGPTILAGLLLYPMDQAPEVLRTFRDFVASAPDEVGVTGNLRLAPPLPVVPEELHGKPVCGIICNYAGSVEDGEKAFAELRAAHEPAVDAVVPKPYVAHQKMLDAALPHGRHYYWKSWRLGPLSDEAIDTTVAQAEAITSPLSSVPIFTLGGAVERVDEDETAFPNRAAQHDINIVASWLPDDPEGDRHIAWVRAFFDALEPHGQGTYVNFLSDEPIERVRAVYGDEKYERLAGLKTTYDPTNFFHHNQNIRPR